MHFNKNAFIHEQTTTGILIIHKEEVPKLVYTLFWCKAVEHDVRIWVRSESLDPHIL